MPPPPPPGGKTAKAISAGSPDGDDAVLRKAALLQALRIAFNLPQGGGATADSMEGTGLSLIILVLMFGLCAWLCIAGCCVTGFLAHKLGWVRGPPGYERVRLDGHQQDARRRDTEAATQLLPLHDADEDHGR